jgi:anti-sigma regulatory factor (Ser/Thr protein kinase)
MAAVPLARHFLQDWLVRVPIEPAEAADLLLVATELAANAVHHASAQPGSILMRASVSGPDIVVELEDDGGHPVTLPDPTDDLPEPLAERVGACFSSGLWSMNSTARSRQEPRESAPSAERW